MSFASQILDFYSELKDFENLPAGFESIFPFKDQDTQGVMEHFYKKYYSDEGQRTFLYGINPGRFGAGITGISFTDPYFLEAACGIPNSWNKRKEISSTFIYEMIDQWGGPTSFYQHFYITSICPIGFVKEGKNANYYDDKTLEAKINDQVIQWMWDQINFGAQRKVAFSIGQGTNFKVLSRLNDVHGFFEEIRPLPHPRWVMQYRRKKMDIFEDRYCDELIKIIADV